jgi:hypothetical protein
MEAMLGISLYSYPYRNSQKQFVFLIIANVFSSTKLDKRVEQVLPGSKEHLGAKGSGGRQGGEMTQTNVCTYEYMNKEKTTLSLQGINIPVKIWAHELNREVSKEEVQMSSKYMKKCSTSLVINEMQIKTTLRFHLTLVRMIFKGNKNKCW